ncbi:MAG: signal peptidase II [Nitrospirae bacterium]|nr:signal peptidase II [Nitrospirota bacterium]
MRKGLVVPAISCSIVILDYVTKQAIESYVKPYDSINVLPFLNIVNVKNPGAAFGIFSNLGNKIFIAISILAIILLLGYLYKIAKRLEILALSLILGGAIGNLIDRISIGKVIDFIDVFVNNWHWPAFNVADSALTVGISIFLWSQMRPNIKRKE